MAALVKKYRFICLMLILIAVPIVIYVICSSDENGYFLSQPCFSLDDRSLYFVIDDQNTCSHVVGWDFLDNKYYIIDDVRSMNKYFSPRGISNNRIAYMMQNMTVSKLSDTGVYISNSDPHNTHGGHVINIDCKGRLSSYVISADGQTILFSGKLNGDGHDLHETPAVIMKTISNGKENIIADAFSPSITSDGSAIAFIRSYTNGKCALLSYDTTRKRLEVINTFDILYMTDINFSISNDGEYVAYTNKDSGKIDCVYIYDRVNKSTLRISNSYSGGSPDSSSGTHVLAFSPTDNILIFDSTANDIIKSVDNQRSNIYLYNISNKTVICASAIHKSNLHIEAGLKGAAISYNGRFVAYTNTKHTDEGYSHSITVVDCNNGNTYTTRMKYIKRAIKNASKNN